MSGSCFNNSRIMTRREFVKVVSAGATGALLMGRPPRKAEALKQYPHWGKVILARDDVATDGPSINAEVVRYMLNQAIEVLTDGQGWRSLFPAYEVGESVAIKVNAINHRMTSHWEVVDAIVAGLVGIGVPENDLMVWDRSSGELSKARYTLNEGSSGVRVMGTNQLKDRYDHTQPVTLKGSTAYLSRILTDATYLINVPILKNHGGTGTTFSLKNHMGSVDSPGVLHNQGLQECIAILNGASPITSKTRLIVGDALFGVYQGGPGGSPQFTYNGLIVGTDPVAIDHQARLILDEERAKHGLGPTRSLHIEQASDLGLGAPIDEVQTTLIHNGAQADDDSVKDTPEGYILRQNIPNPFNTRTTILYVLPEAGPVQLAIYNASGQRIQMLVQDYQRAGSHRVVWDGRDDAGQDVASGVYGYRLTAGSYAATRRLSLIR